MEQRSDPLSSLIPRQFVGILYKQDLSALTLSGGLTEPDLLFLRINHQATACQYTKTKWAYFMTSNDAALEHSQPSILSFVKDLPNLCSLAGLACTISAIYFSIIGVFEAAMIGMVWAVAFDWADGLIARKLKGRSTTDMKFGGQLDVLIDIVSYGVTPAILLLSYGDFKPVYLIGMFIMLAAGVMRLSYFSIFGLAGGSRYKGLAIDNNSLALVFLFLFERFMSQGLFSIILFVCCIALAALNVSNISTPKLSGNPVNVVLLAVYTIVVSGIYGAILLA